MPHLEDLERDEFVQNYLQYRWLDDTRTKLMDRYFLVLLAVLAARFQFPFLEDHAGWLSILYGLFVLFATFMAKSIISFRRQQRGHSLFIKAIQSRILSSPHCDCSKFKQYVEYLKGRPIFLTAWIEFVVALTATLSPLLFLDVILGDSIKLSALSVAGTTTIVVLAVALNAWFLLVSYFRYNRPATPDWTKR